MSHKIISILGSTGSIGRQTLAVAAASEGRVTVEALAARGDVDSLEQQARQFRPRLVALMDPERAAELKERLRDLPVRVSAGLEGLVEAAVLPQVDTVVTAVSGSIGLEPTLAAIEAGKHIALANKETLVAAGELVMEAAVRRGVNIMPVDSEHSAIFQALLAGRSSEVRRLILTASGGPFRGWELERMRGVTPQDALRHPNWTMGAKITIDSATMMNKALEVIEAHFLFAVPYEKISVLVHPQSIIHSLVEYEDGAVIAQAGAPDMRLPIQYALSWPQRWPVCHAPLELTGQSLDFAEPDRRAFPALELGLRCARAGGTLPAVMNAANEVFVQAFLEGRIGFTDIVELTERVTEAHKIEPAATLTAVLAADSRAREYAEEIVIARGKS